MRLFTCVPRGPFDLAVQNTFFGGWLTYKETALAVTFPVEGWLTSATVMVRQSEDGAVSGEVHGADGSEEKAWTQALAALSLDADGAGWPEVGARDPVIGALQKDLQYLRPVLFHSPYEAAAAFIIGHRITMTQTRAIRQAMARQFGDAIQVNGETFYAFPQPQVLAELQTFKGVSGEKIARLHGIAQAAQDGMLDRTTLRSLPLGEALDQLRTLRGVGELFAQGILLRGAGVTDELPDDTMTKKAIQAAYNLSDLPSQVTIARMAEAWRPYRMWTTVLLHAWFRRRE